MVSPAQANIIQRITDEIETERQRQIYEEGYTPNHDFAEHCDNELIIAAAGYCQVAINIDLFIDENGEPRGMYPIFWPMSPNPWPLKPQSKRRSLIKAAALIVAEIERMDAMKGK